MQTKRVTPLVNTYQNKRLNSPNDLTIDYANTVYFIDPNWNTPSNINSADIQSSGKVSSTESGQRIYSMTLAEVDSDKAPTIKKNPKRKPLPKDLPRKVVTIDVP